MASANYPHGLQSLSPGTSMDRVLARLGDFREEPLDGASPYVKPASIKYQIDGKERRWDIVKAMASVGVLIYHTSKDAFLLVRQFRPPLYATKCRDAAELAAPPPGKEAGFTIELCAGLVDKGGKSLAQVAAEEVEEECGFRVDSSALRPLTTAICASGTMGVEHHLFYCEVDDSMRVNDGGGFAGHGEAIEVLALPSASANAFVFDASVPKSPGLMFAVTWAANALVRGEIGRRGGAAALETAPLELRPVLPS